MSENKLRRLRFNGQDLLDLLMPIGFQYEMYPVAHSNDPDVAFPPSERPAALWPGTEGELIDDDEGVFYRTEGGSHTVGRVNGLQGDAIRNIVGQFSNGLNNSASGTFSGAFQELGSSQNGAGTANVIRPGLRFDASRVVPTSTENRPANRLFRIYRRTA